MRVGVVSTYFFFGKQSVFFFFVGVSVFELNTPQWFLICSVAANWTGSNRHLRSSAVARTLYIQKKSMELAP